MLHRPKRDLQYLNFFAILESFDARVFISFFKYFRTRFYFAMKIEHEEILAIILILTLYVMFILLTNIFDYNLTQGILY